MSESIRCLPCSRRLAKSPVPLTDADFEQWRMSEAAPECNTSCPHCLGTLEYGKPIADSIAATFSAGGYTDIFNCPLSIQLPALLVLANAIENVLFEGRIEVREILRNFIYRCVSECLDESKPKLYLDVNFHLLPTPMSREVVSAVNARIRKSDKSPYKKYKDGISVNISDIQLLVESWKADIGTIHSALFPNDIGSDKTIESMKHDMEKKFFASHHSFFATCTSTLKRETIYISGKYVKRTREFGQSAWDANTSSVAETVCPYVCALFNSPVEKCLFSASGREDMDVRMLSSGRPFVLQLSDAKNLRPILEKNALASVSIDTGDVIVAKGLAWADKGVMDWLHWSTEQHVKIYKCVVWSEQIFPSQDEITSILGKEKDIKILQKTPLRVLHRRTEHTREKYIHSIQLERLNAHFAMVTLHASAGAYIKEFIHGDFGRTRPAFCDILFKKPVQCDILQLDVMEVIQDEDEDYVPLRDRN